MSKTGADLPLVVAASQLGNASMKGYLEKKRPSKKLLSIKYQRRWCLVYGNLFLYYDSPDDKAQKGGFSLESYRFLHSPGHSPFGFSLVSQHKRKFEFMAPSQDEYINWEKAIKKGISLTRRSKEPLNVKPLHTSKDDQDLNKKHANLEKMSTMPNMKIPERPRIPPGIYNSSPYSVGAKTFPDTTKTQTNNVAYSPKIQERKAMQEASKYELNIKGNKTSDSESDSDSDGDGYIKTAKLNLPKTPIKRTENTPIDDTKDYTQDDYMIVLPNIPPDKSVKAESPYVEFKSDEIDSKMDGTIEKLYCSVKKPFIGTVQQRSESDYALVGHSLLKDEDNNEVTTRNPAIGFIQQRSESDYASVDHSVLKSKDGVVKGSRNPGIGAIKQRSESDYASVDSITVLHRQTPPSRKAEQSSNSGYVTVDHYGLVTTQENDEADSDDDYVNPHTVVDYTSLNNMHLPQRKVQPVSSSSTESESDDSDDYMKPGCPLKTTTNNNKQVDEISYLSSESSDTDDQLSDQASLPIIVDKVYDPIYENFAQ